MSGVVEYFFLLHIGTVKTTGQKECVISSIKISLIKIHILVYAFVFKNIIGIVIYQINTYGAQMMQEYNPDCASISSCRWSSWVIVCGLRLHLHVYRFFFCGLRSHVQVYRYIYFLNSFYPYIFTHFFGYSPVWSSVSTSTGSSPLSWNSYQPGRLKNNMYSLRVRWSQPTACFQTAAHGTSQGSMKHMKDRVVPHTWAHRSQLLASFALSNSEGYAKTILLPWLADTGFKHAITSL